MINENIFNYQDLKKTDRTKSNSVLSCMIYVDTNKNSLIHHDKAFEQNISNANLSSIKLNFMIFPLHISHINSFLLNFLT